MSYVNVAPQLMAGAAADAAGIGSAISQAHAAAAPATTSVLAAAADEVSSAAAAFFSQHGQAFSALGAQASAFHDQFVNALNGGAAHYLDAELANAQQTSAQAVAAAAVNPMSQSFRFPYGPFTISGTQTVTPVGEGFDGVTNAAVNLGPVKLLSANAIENYSAVTGVGSATFAVTGPFISGMGNAAFSDVTGSFSANFAGNAPLMSVGLSVNGTYPVTGTGSPHITGAKLEIDGVPQPTQGITSALNSLLQSSSQSSISGS
jgi:hypothetical protein